MKQALLIRFRASQLEWLIHDGGRPILEGQGDWQALKEALAGWSGNPDELEAAVLMEGRSTLMTQITVPSKPTRQILDAIPFLVEEQIAGNLDDCFISLGAREGDRLAVVVVDRRVVEEILLAADEAGLAVSFLGVDTQVLQSKGATRLVLEQDVAHVIRSSGVGLSLLSEHAEQVLGDELSEETESVDCLDFCETEGILATSLAASSIELNLQSARAGTIEPSLLRQWSISAQDHAVNLRQGEFSFKPRGGALMTLLRRVATVVLLLLGSQLVVNVAQALYLDYQAHQLETEAQELYLAVFPQDRAPKDMARRWRSRLAGPGDVSGSAALELVEKLSGRVSQSGLTLQNLNFNLARGDLSLQLVGRTSDQIMRLSEALGSEGLQSDIGTISQEDGEVRATLRLKAGQ
jgi:general secretion pathway protein L